MVGEFDLIELIRRGLPARPADLVIGPGDDCACARTGDSFLLMTDDAMVEGVHFARGMLGFRALGRRAAAAAISDVAAMGGEPRWLLASVGAPPGIDTDLVDLGLGIADRAAASGACLAGGNITRAGEIFVSISVVGYVDSPPLTRSGARAGDLVALTGPIGGAALGLAALLEGRAGTEPAASLAASWREPPDRVRAGMALLGIATAAIDISDGFLQDLGHMSRMSGVGARIEVDRIPLPAGYRELAPPADPLGPALAGGEDYELLVAIPPGSRDAASRALASAGATLHVVGEFTAEREALVLVDSSGAETGRPAGGWDHFREPGEPISRTGR